MDKILNKSVSNGAGINRKRPRDEHIDNAMKRQYNHKEEAGQEEVEKYSDEEAPEGAPHEENEEENEEESEEESEDEFYTPGTEELLQTRKNILKYSVPKASERIENQIMAAKAENSAQTLRHRHSIAQYMELMELDASYTMKGNTRALAVGRFNCDSSMIACSSWDGGISVVAKEKSIFSHLARLATGFHSEKTVLDWSPIDSSVLVSGGSEGTVNMWRMNTDDRSFSGSSGAGSSGSSGSSSSSGSSGATGSGCGMNEIMKPIESVKIAHGNRISLILFHPSGLYYATTSYDLTWKLWDLNRPDTELLEQEGHAKEVHTAAFHPDGSLLATGGLDSVGRVWDLRSGRSIAVLSKHAKGIYSMDWSPNGYHLASASGDNSVQIWDLRKLQKHELFSIPAHTKLVSGVRFLQKTSSHVITKPVKDENEENERLMDVSGTVLVTSSFDGTVKIWSADNWVCLKTLRGHSDKVMSCDISSDGSTIISTGWDRTLKTWLLI